MNYYMVTIIDKDDDEIMYPPPFIFDENVKELIKSIGDMIDHMIDHRIELRIREISVINSDETPNNG